MTLQKAIPKTIGKIKAIDDLEMFVFFGNFAFSKMEKLTMSKLLGVLLAASLALCVSSSYADDMMKKDEMAKDSMSKDTMGKDSMAKDSMANDGMKKDGMMKKKHMSKHHMKKDAMMKKDDMAPDSMKKDDTAH